ncbi:hypothetical protein [Nocardia wallacei]|uniref:hypothetical protein n=1 Tax=Nocardia wallacei TaxID=480035 RepID=UPI0024573469|nr:hypothetical protein [Nocardia wallacei]
MSGDERARMFVLEESWRDDDLPPAAVAVFTSFERARDYVAAKTGGSVTWSESGLLLDRWCARHGDLVWWLEPIDVDPVFEPADE